MNRRRFLSTMGLASSAVLNVPAIAYCDTSKPVGASAPIVDFFPGFQTREINCSRASIHLVMGGDGPPLLLLHGYPQSHIIWRKIAPQIAKHFTVVAPDLRGYGDSSRPADGENHSGFSKRAMAHDQIEIMEHLGFEQFAVVGHDRGARVAHRLALDHPAAVKRLALLDIVPTYRLYADVKKDFAISYFHWFFLIQPAPLPESMIENSLEAWFNWSFGGTPPPWMEEAAYREYLRCVQKPGTVHAQCEDYRASATIDLSHDAADLDRKVECPLLALWGSKGAMHSMYDVLQTWKQRAVDVRGQALDAGHFLPEEAPGPVLDELLAFLLPR